MRKNIKFTSRSLPTVPVLMAMMWIFLCSYVWLSCKIIAIGYKMEEAKKKYEEMYMLNQNYKAEFLRISSPEHLLKIIRNAGLHLENPSTWCYVDIKIAPEKEEKNGTVEAGTY